MKNRFGGRAKKRLKNRWEDLKTPTAPEAAPETMAGLKYTDVKGIWGLNYTSLLPGGGGGGTALGLSESLFTVSGENDAWTERNIDLGAYAGTEGHIVFRYTSGDSFRGDLQLDLINGNSFENTSNSFQTSSSGETNYESVSWGTLSVGTTNGRWNVDQGGTPSGSTARTDAPGGSYYVYAETTSSFNYNFWLRSPELVAPSSLTFYEARYGANIGTLDVYFDRTT